jgi:tRNA (mo5U34)-methyltransferase
LTENHNDIARLLQRGDDYAKYLAGIKQQIAPTDFEWYRYDSMGSLEHLDGMLQGRYRDLIALAAGDPVLDFGCADGDLAFFLESQGLRVHTFDHVRTNHNGMKGVRTLKQHLGSKIHIHEVNLDQGFAIPEGRYGLALVLGILYHLKNPFYVMETIARSARYCVLSTRVTRYLPDRSTDISNVPVAYLLGPTELNRDDSNYWIFSETGLRRLVERAHWRVVGYRSVGSGESDPVSLEYDQRAYMLLESTFGMRHFHLLDGWYEPEREGWRWTARRFRVRIEDARSITIHLFVPPELIQRFGPVTLSGEVNGVPLAPEIWEQGGELVYMRQLPGGPADVSWTLSHAFPPSDTDERELGVVVARLDAE